MPPREESSETRRQPRKRKRSRRERSPLVGWLVFAAKITTVFVLLVVGGFKGTQWFQDWRARRTQAQLEAAVEKLGNPAEHQAAAALLLEHRAQSLPLLVEAVKSGGRRLGAIQALETMGAEAKEAVPGLIQALDDPNDKVQDAAMRALGKIGPEARAAVPTLLTRLNSEATALAALREDLKRLRDNLAQERAELEKQKQSWKSVEKPQSRDDVLFGKPKTTWWVKTFPDGATSAQDDYPFFFYDKKIAELEAKIVAKSSTQGESKCVPLMRTLGQIGPDARAAAPLIAAELAEVREELKLDKDALAAEKQKGWRQVSQTEVNYTKVQRTKVFESDSGPTTSTRFFWQAKDGKTSDQDPCMMLEKRIDALIATEDLLTDALRRVQAPAVVNAAKSP